MLSLTNRPRVRSRFDAVLGDDASLLKNGDVHEKIKARQCQSSIRSPLLSLSLFLSLSLSLSLSSFSLRFSFPERRRAMSLNVEGRCRELGTSYH